MNQNQNQKKRRRFAAFIAILLALALVFSALAPLLYAVQTQAAVIATPQIANETMVTKVESQAEEMGLDRFSVNLTVGFDQGYIVGKTTPIYGVIENLGEAFEGELRLQVADYEGSEGVSRSHSEYYIPLSLPKGGVKQIEMFANLSVVRRYFQLTLVDTQGQVVYLKNIEVKALDPSVVMVGVLTEHPESVGYLSALNMAGDFTNKLSKTTFFNQVTFPDRVDVLSNMRAIIIENFDTKQLTQEQMDALVGFVSQGGMLIIGTGSNAVKTLGGLQAVANFQMGESQTITSFPVLNEVLQTNVSQYGPMTITPISAEGLSGVFMEDGQVITSAMKYGGGNIMVHHFALSLEPVSAIPNMPVFLRSIYAAQDPILFDVDYEKPAMSEYIFWLSDTFPFLNEKGLLGVLVCVGSYILLVGPILYLYLKKKNKQEKGWLFIPILALVFTAVVFLIGRGSVYQNTLLRSVSVTDLPSQGTTATAHISVSAKVGDSGDVNIQLGEPLESVAFDDGGYYHGAMPKKSELKRKILAAGDTEITYFDKSRWETSSLTGNAPQNLEGNIVSSLRLGEDGKIQGKLVNETGLDFQDVLISVNEQYFRLSPMAAGESLAVDEKLREDTTNNYYYNYIGMALGLHDENGERLSMQEMIRNNEITKQEAFDINQKMRLLDHIYDTDMNASVEESEKGVVIGVFAFSNAPVLQGDVKVNGKTPIASHLGLYRTATIQRWAEVENFEIPFGMIMPKMDETQNNFTKYNDYSVFAENGGELECQFVMPEDISVHSFTINNSTDDANLNRETQIYNCQTNEYETLFYSEYTNPSQYIDEDGTIRLSYSIKRHTEISLPEISIKGAGNNASN